MTDLRFDERVAIVTGAGGGLGRSHALLLAGRGCKVVVNDLGGNAHGDGASQNAADKVVEEIRAAGGEAVANYDSVENGESIVQTALDAFGTVDIVINNAGILRDVSFHKMDQAAWDLVLKVHLMGTESVTRAAWPIMRDKRYGRVIMTTSAAGIYGNFGQANYSAAKLGMLGLANTLAIEGASKGIQVNTIAPIAASRLTATVLPEDILQHLKPEAVSPLVAWLCHEDCQENHGLFEVGAGYIGKLRWERTVGHCFAPGRAFTPDDIAKQWNKITNFDEATHPADVTQSMAPIITNVTNPPLGGNEFIDLDVAANAEVEVDSSYDERDLSLYALGIGAAHDPLDKNELAYVYELGSDFQAFPTYGVMPQMNAMLDMAKQGKSPLPGMNFGFDRLLHGEQYTEIKRPLPPHAKLHHTFTLKKAYDKDPNAVITFAISSKDETGEELIYNEMTAFVKGAGGWGGDRGPSGDDVNCPPEREPDAIIEEQTDANQTLLYRLSGDWNPLHADPQFAQQFGYDKPILHGLCTFGFAGRHVIKAFANNDGRYFKSIKVRFAATVYPGDTLETRMWKESPTRIVFEVRAKERDELVIKNAAIELYEEIPQPKAKAKPTAAKAAPAAAVDESLTAEDVFGVIAAYVDQHPELVSQTGTSFQFHITDPDSDWILDLKNGDGSCKPGVGDKADVTLELASKHLATVMSGSVAEAQKLFFGGDLKISGNIMASNKLTSLSAIPAADFEAARQARIAAGGSAASAASTAAEVDESLTAADIFTAIDGYVKDNPQLVDEVKTVFQFHITEPDFDWVLDLKNNASCTAGVADKADVTLTVGAEHLPKVMGGDVADAQKLFFGGQLKISGNIMASNKLTALKGMEEARVEEARQARIAGGGTTTKQEKAEPKRQPKEAQAPAIFAALADKLNGDTPIKQLLQFHITEPDASWVIDFTQQPPKVSEGSNDKAGTTFTLSDADLVTLAKGGTDIRAFYQQGKLRVDGDITPAHHLEFLANAI